MMIVIFLSLLNLCEFASARKIDVCPKGCALQTIQEAVRVAPPRSQVVVHPATYLEKDILINKPLELVVSSQGGVIIDAQEAGAHFIVTADDVTIRGFELRNPGFASIKDIAAVRVRSANRCIFANNQIVNSTYGIYIEKSTGCTILDNHIRSNRRGAIESGSGIHVWQSTNVEIVRNKISGHRDGIYFEFVSHSRIVENESEENLRYGLHFMFSNENDYQRNTFRKNQSGVAVMYSKKINMRANRFEQSYGPASFGLLLKDISDSLIVGNLIKDNTTGFFVEGVSRTLISDNDVIQNGWAIRIVSSSENNTFISNNFLDSTFEVAALAGANSNVFSGNYWSRYEGVDLDRNNIGDHAHRPASLSGVWVQTIDGAALLLNSFFLHLIDLAEATLPSLVASQIVDEHPLMRMRP
ncbi:MAG: nitrous oxide reductase family maturation protein NosD [Oligoflexia bacterium]|nr:nitrous oxide reductase family maturation protein NosD [Oligoflexia bacterium]